MDDTALRTLIREKLRDGRLPLDMTRLWGGPADGELCDACGQPITKQQLVMEGMSNRTKDAKPIHLHVTCFQIWEVEKRKLWF